ncbi:PP2C family protein-serine/threonine phosphatase [Streptomyces sp. TRM 70351]|nr:PP2C family protein-serine/threonine phosphatase [Streptomyces sp. TRM 70351]MEE1930500.1 PP2C family protein-serine/threonine phosphatase [Streptomyces sp. TRM 70351]
MIDASGTVREVNEAARALFPRAAPGRPVDDVAPGWLGAAHRRLSAPPPGGGPAAVPDEPARGRAAGRSFAAHPTPLDDGGVAWWLVDDTEHRLAEESLRHERERTAFLAEASNRLLSSLNLDRCMEVTAELASRHLADAAVVFAPAARGRALSVVGCAGDGPPFRMTAEGDPAAVPGLAEALQGSPPVPSRWADPSAAPQWLVPGGFGPVGSMVVTPLPGHGAPAGALVLLRRTGRDAFTGDEELFARMFAARAGAALSAARMYAEQARITETLMRELLPPPLRHLDGVEFAAGYRPSGTSERIGGDFYDVHPAAAGGVSLAVLGDVCGKGLEAAVLAGKIRNTLQALLPMADDHQRMLRLLNGALLSSHHTRFATLVLASAAREGDHVALRVTSAGHPPPLVVRADGRVETVDTAGSLVGALPEIGARTARLRLAPGETCLLFTDGVTEARGGPLGDAMFGEDRLAETLSHCAGMPAEAVVEHVQMLAAQWTGANVHDDMAVVAITAPRGAHLSAVDGHTPGRFTS